MKNLFSKNYLIILLLLVSGQIWLYSCSKDDEKPIKEPEEEIVTNYTIYQSEIVSITLARDISEDNFNGTFDGNPIVVVKIDDKTVAFFVPFSTEPGIKHLKVDGLDNLNIEYEVKVTILS